MDRIIVARLTICSALMISYAVDGHLAGSREAATDDWRDPELRSIYAND